jgi:hypothetical protein
VHFNQQNKPSLAAINSLKHLQMVPCEPEGVILKELGILDNKNILVLLVLSGGPKYRGLVSVLAQLTKTGRY